MKKPQECHMHPYVDQYEYNIRWAKSRKDHGGRVADTKNGIINGREFRLIKNNFYIIKGLNRVYANR